jgi:hypothetical protein
MAKFTADVVLDTPLDKIATATRLSVCTGQPTNLSELAAMTLASVVVASGEFTKANGDVSGRKTSTPIKTNVPITASGDATHLVLDDATDLLHGTTCALQALTINGTVTIPSWNIEFRDPI